MVEECPYPGLAAFGPGDARWFFGRDTVLAELTGLLSQPPAGQGPVVLVAPSGAGKSSLLRAGLIPELDRGVLPQAGSRHWPRLLFTPTAHPVAALAAQLSGVVVSAPEEVSAALADHPGRAVDLIRDAVAAGRVPGGGVAVAVDQFEETFALCDDEREQRVFVEALCALGSAADPAVGVVVLGLRADFYLHACAYPALRTALRDCQVLMGPMSETDLRQAIEFPSQVVGLEVEPGLVELLIRDLGGTRPSGSGAGDVPGYEAGRLPLLAHALRVTWQQRHGHVLTVDGYAATGGIHHAIAASAERTFGRLASTEQELARLLFLRLIKIGDGTEDTRRRAVRAELVQGSGLGAGAEAVIDAFTKARLLTHERETVEITHEALLREWPRLRGWIDTDRVGHLVHQDLEEQAAAWEVGGRDALGLYRGPRLEAASNWAASAASRDEMTTRARAFLAASVRQKRRTARLRQGAVAALTALALVASGLALFASAQRQSAIHDKEVAFFNQVSAKAASLNSTDVSLAAELDLVAYRMNPTRSGYTNLINTEATGLATPLTLGATTFGGAAFGPRGRVFAAAGGRTIRLWNTTDPRRPVLLGPSLPGVTASVDTVAISPDGHTLTAGLSDGTVRSWDITHPAHPTAIGAPLRLAGAGISALAMFSPRGHLLLTYAYKNLQLWNVSRPAKPAFLSTLRLCAPNSTDSVDISPDGRLIAAGCLNSTIRLADVADPARPRALGGMTGSTDRQEVSSLAFSPNGRTLVSASYYDQTFMLWDVTDPRRPAALGTPVSGVRNGITGESFSPDGSVLATADHDGTVQLWNIADPASVSDLGQPMTAGAGTAIYVAFSPAGQALASGYTDGRVLLWNIPHPMVTANATGYMDSLAFSPDGTLLARTNDSSGTVNLWDLADGSHQRRAGNLAACSLTTGLIAFDPRRHVLAVGCDGGSLWLWNTADPFHGAALGPPLVMGPANNYVESVAFDHSGKILAAATNYGAVTLWNVADPAHATKIDSLLAPGRSGWTVVSLSPDGRTLAVGAGSTVRLWDVTDPAKPRAIGAPLTGPTQGVTSLTFSHQGGLLAASDGDDNIYLWDVAGPHRGRPAGQTLAGHTDLVTSVAFSPDDRVLASSSDDFTVRLWDISRPGNAAPLGEPLTGHTDYALAVAFSPKGHTLASIGLDGVVYLWDTNVNDAISRICATTHGVLTPARWKAALPGVPYNPPCPAR